MAKGHTAARSPSPTLTLWDELCCESSSSYSETHIWTRWYLHCMKMTSNTWLCLPACNTIQYPEWTILEPNIRRSSVSGFKFLWKQHTSSSHPLLSLSLHTLPHSPSLHTQNMLSCWCWCWGCKMESSIAHQVSVAEICGCSSIDHSLHSHSSVARYLYLQAMCILLHPNLCPWMYLQHYLFQYSYGSSSFSSFCYWDPSVKHI